MRRDKAPPPLDDIEISGAENLLRREVRSKFAAEVEVPVALGEPGVVRGACEILPGDRTHQRIREVGLPFGGQLIKDRAER